jgi:GR25 family glycosyltransferase involved in LPS biosynthesis
MIGFCILTIEDEKKIQEKFRTLTKNRNLNVVLGVAAESEIDRYISDDYLLERYGRRLSRGEIGCALGHKKISQKMLVLSYKTAVILEDDAIIEHNFENQIDVIGEILEKEKAPMVIVLGHSKTIKRNLWFENLKYRLLNKKTIKEITIGEKEQNFFGTVGYACNQGFMKLIADQVYLHLADDWGYWMENGVKVYHLEKPIVWEDLNTKSSTGNTVHVHHNISSLSFLKEIYVAIKNNIKRHE